MTSFKLLVSLLVTIDLFYCAPQQLYHTESQHLSEHPMTAVILRNTVKHTPLFSKYLKNCNTQGRHLDFNSGPLITRFVFWNNLL